MRAVLTLFVAVATLTAATSGAGAQQVSEAEAIAAINEFAAAVAKGDPAGVEVVLAPEFQILRSGGARNDRDGYVAAFPGSHSVAGDITPSQVRVSGSDGLMVVTYDLDISETINGAPVQKQAPRLTVFRFIDGRWKVAAHANFAAIVPAN